jgi:hypothetical protein
VDPAALERFASGADERRAAVGSAESVPSAVVSAEAPSPAEATAAPVAPTAPTPAAATPAPDLPNLVAAAATAPVVAERSVAAVQLKPPADGAEKASEQVLWRVSPSTLALYNFVFDNTNVKSKQKLLDSILLPELERRAEEIRKGR